jgi:SAM-dependent methyltransferase
MTKHPTPIVTYDAVADEYYDAVRHPTCANFSELSSRFLVTFIRRYAGPATEVLEIGAGCSTAAPVLAQAGISLSRLTLLDKSPAMLDYSREWADQGAHLIVGDALNPALPTGNFGLIVASLGDPYNCRRFWISAAALLEPHGICLFTTPAHEWASRFRDASMPSAAEFVVGNGDTVLVPSKILPLVEQIQLLANSGLQVVETQSLSAAELSGPPSPKLLLTAETLHLAIVQGLVAQKG